MADKNPVGIVKPILIIWVVILVGGVFLKGIHLVEEKSNQDNYEQLEWRMNKDYWSYDLSSLKSEYSESISESKKAKNKKTEDSSSESTSSSNFSEVTSAESSSTLPESTAESVSTSSRKAASSSSAAYSEPELTPSEQAIYDRGVDAGYEEGSNGNIHVY